MSPLAYRGRVAAGLGVVLVVLAVSAQGLARPVSKSASATTSRTIVKLAQRELSRGVHEIPDGSNRAPAIRRYETATAGAAYGAPWCAYFVSYVAKMAGVPIGPGGRGVGYVPYIRAWAHQTGRWTSRPRPGELITFPQHVGIVETVFSNHTLTTIEGNHSNAVTRVYRRWSEAMGYVRLAGGNPAPTAPTQAPALPKPPPRHLPPLTARITAYPGTAIATGQTIQFSSDDSSGNVKRSDWDLDGNGKVDAHGDNVSRTFRNAGKHKVTLTVFDDNGRKSVTQEQILVRENKAPVARFTVSAGNVMVGDTVTADASQSVDPDGRIVDYSWDLDGNGDWSSDGVQHSLKYTVAGDYYAGLRVTDDSGNVTEVHVPIHVADYPEPQSRIVCDSTSLATGKAARCSADDSGSPTQIVRHEWDMDDDGSTDSRGGSVRWTYRRPGSYTIHLTVTDKHGHTQESTQDVTVTNQPPTARMSGPTRLSVGQSATYDARGSSDADGSIAGYAWRAADQPGTHTLSGSGRAWTFTPTAPGVYSVAVAVSDDTGGTGTASMTVTVVGQPPVATITMPAATQLVVGRSTQLDATASTSPYGDLASYAWDLDGDGTYETEGATPTFTPDQSGRRTIRLEVTDAFGATATTQAFVRIYAAPQPVLTAPSNATVKQVVTFSSAGSTDPDGRIVSYGWDFDGDGVVDRTMTSAGSTTWTFANAGSFLVTLVATDNDGLKTTSTSSIVVAAPPTGPGTSATPG
jgi:PKD repeat protein